jgi:hypothetical protein
VLFILWAGFWWGIAAKHHFHGGWYILAWIMTGASAVALLSRLFRL